MRLTLAALTLATLAALGGCAESPPPPASTVAQLRLSAGDARFVAAALALDAFETETAELALRRSPTDRVLRFAARMQHDHDAQARRLRDLVASKGAAPVAAPEPTLRDHLQQLRAASVRRFYPAFWEGQLAGHLEAVAVFKREAAEGYDTDLVAYARARLPLLEEDLRMARIEGR